MKICILSRPELFQKGNMSLFSNKYIAKNVIRQHLDPNINSGTRKKEIVERSVEWICGLTPTNGKILDVGCGPGIYAKRLSTNRYSVDGLDISKYNIDYAIHHFQNEINPITYICSDILKTTLTQKYNTIIILYALYSFFCKEDRIIILKKLYDALEDNGSLIIEVFQHKHYAGREESTDWEYIKKNGFWKEGEYLELNAFYRYDEDDTILVRAAVIDDAISVWNSWIKMFNLESLYEEIKSVGIDKITFFDDVTGHPYTGNSDTICAVINK